MITVAEQVSQLGITLLFRCTTWISIWTASFFKDLDLPFERHLLVIPGKLFNAFNTMKPGYSISRELLNSRLQCCFMQREVINCSRSQNQIVRRATTLPPHQSSAFRAERILHIIACLNGFGLQEPCELLETPNSLDLALLDNEVGTEHGGRDLSTICACADEGVN